MTSIAPNIGYGSHGLQLAEALIELGKDIRILGLEGPNIPEEFAIPKSHMVMNWVDWNPKAPTVVVNVPSILGKFSGSPRIGFPVWETSRIPEKLVQQMKWCDHIITTNEWTRSVFENHGIKARVVPEGVNPKIFNPNVSGAFRKKLGDTYNFYSCGKYEIRKGHDLVLRAWKEAFPPEYKDVRLVLDWHNPFRPKLSVVDDILRKEGMDQDRRIIILRPEKLMIRADRAKIYAAMDCGLFPNRAEAWNLPLCEMLAMGIPCIASKCTAHLDYVYDGKFLSLLKADEMSDARDDFFFKSGDFGQWFEPDYDELKNDMFGAYSAKMKYDEAAGFKFGMKWSWKEAARKFVKVLNEMGVDV